MSFVFFTDRDLGKHLPDILVASGLHVERHCDHFRHDCKDDEWLAEIGKRGWVAITHDRRIRYKPNELAAVIRHRVILLVVIGQAKFPALAQNFVATEPKIEKFLLNKKPPLIAKVYRPTDKELEKNPDANGAIKLWYPEKLG